MQGRRICLAVLVRACTRPHTQQAKAWPRPPWTAAAWRLTWAPLRYTKRPARPALIRLSCILPLSLIPSINMHPFLIPPLPCFLERITGLTWLDWWKQCNLESLLTPIHVRSVISTSWKEKEEGEMHQIIGAGPRSSQYISILKQKHSL